MKRGDVVRLKTAPNKNDESCHKFVLKNDCGRIVTLDIEDNFLNFFKISELEVVRQPKSCIRQPTV